MKERERVVIDIAVSFIIVRALFCWQCLYHGARAKSGAKNMTRWLYLAGTRRHCKAKQAKEKGPVARPFFMIFFCSLSDWPTCGADATAV